MNMRGIYEREKGSGIWWIRYSDSTGRIRREKAGTESAAIALQVLSPAAGRCVLATK